MQMRDTIVKMWHVILLGSAVFLMVVALFLALSFGWRGTESVQWVAHSHEVMHAADHAVAAATDAGAEFQGDFNKSSPVHRQSFEEIEGLVRDRMRVLKDLVVDSDLQVARVDRLGTLLDARLEDIRTGFHLLNSGKRSEAFARVYGEEGLQRIAEIRGVQRQIEGEEHRLLETRRESLKTEMFATLITVIITSAIALLLVFNAFLIMRRAQQALEREAELLRAKEQAERADKEKSEFLANMSHEIRTPMNSVLGFGELLRGIVTTPKQKQYVEAINTSGKALLSIINDILDLSKIAAGKLELNPKPISIREVLDSVATLFEPQAGERGLRLVLEVEDNVPHLLVFDALRLRQILFNTVGNAIKFTQRGKVTVRAWAEPTSGDAASVTLRLSVRDTGIGIDPQNHALIFEPFRQVSSGLNSTSGGTGLGLSITRRLAEMLNGTIEVRSALGAGSDFVFTFLRVPKGETLFVEEAVERQTENFDEIRASLILIADDVALNRQLLAEHFSGSKHRLLFAATGRETEEAALRFHPDLILMDIRMPDVNGREVRDGLRSRPELSTVPIVAVTASTLNSEDDQLKGQFDGYLRKPFTRSELFAHLVRLLPPARKGDTAAPVGRSEPPMSKPTEGDPGQWGEISAWLKGQETDSWPSLSRSMGFRETENFAREMISRATHANCPLVREFGKKLLNEVQNFDIQAQERTMKTFPQIVQTISQAIKERVG